MVLSPSHASDHFKISCASSTIKNFSPVIKSLTKTNNANQKMISILPFKHFNMHVELEY